MTHADKHKTKTKIKRRGDPLFSCIEVACVFMGEGYGDSKEFAFCERFTLASP
jgi:hypothetical protein